MPDMLVKLYDLPPAAPVLARPQQQGVTFRRVIAPEKHHVLTWIGRHFSAYWQSECDVAFSYTPPTCWIATRDERLLGFACYDTTKRGFFGPTGVGEAARGLGIGTALLLLALHDMAAVGYGYAIIGAAGPTAFYEKTVGAIAIPNSEPGVYAGMLRTDAD